MRVFVTIEPEAARMLDELVARLYPSRHLSQARAQVSRIADALDCTITSLVRYV